MLLSASSALSSRDSDRRSHRDRNASSSAIRVVVIRSRLFVVIVLCWAEGTHGKVGERSVGRKSEIDGERQTGNAQTGTDSDVRSVSEVQTTEWAKHL